METSQGQEDSQGTQQVNEVEKSSLNVTSTKVRSGDINTTMQQFNRNTARVATTVLVSLVLFAGLLAIQGGFFDGRPHLAYPADSSGLTQFVQTASPHSGVAPDAIKVGNSKRENIDNESSTAAVTATPNIDSARPVLEKDLVPTFRSKQPRHKKRLRLDTAYTGVKAQLLELWHQSLRRDQEVRGWASVSRLNKTAKKKVSFTEKKDKN